MSNQQPVKEELTNVTKSLILSILIDKVMNNYNYKNREERTATINTIKARVNQYIIKRLKSNKKETEQAYDIATKIWNSTLDDLESLSMKVEIVSTVVRLHNTYSQILTKYVNLTGTLINKYSNARTKHNSEEIDADSFLMVNTILDKLSVYTGVKRRELNLKQKVKKC